MYISIDLGGTKTRVASTQDLKSITKDVTFATSQDLETQQKLLNESIEKVLDGGELLGLCLGVPGIVDKKEKILRKVINVKSLDGLKAEQLFSRSMPKENLFVENDASLAGLGEAVFGAGLGVNVVAYITLSTGVGGVRISEKKIDPYQKSVEPGHTIIKDSDKVFSMCGQKGCFSYYCSGTGFEENYGTSPITCTDEKIWGSYAKDLSRGLINVIAMWNPEKIVLGGSMTNAYERYFEKPLKEALAEQAFFEIPQIEIAKLGNLAGVYGGFAYLSQSL